MQLLSRLMDHVLAKRAQRTTIVVATSGDTGGAAVDAFAGRDNVDLVVLFPHGRISDVQRRMMTTSGASNVHALAIEGTFRRLPGDREGAVQSSQLSRSRSRCPASTRSTGRGSSRRWCTTSPRRWRSARPRARSISPCRPAISATSLPATSPSGWACRSRWLRIAANVNDILPRTLKTGIYEVREVHATASPSMDIQVSSNFERLLFEAGGPRRRQRAPADGVARTVRTLRAARRDAGGDPRANSTPAAPTRPKPRPRSAPPGARPAIWSIRIPRWRWRWPIATPRIRRFPTSCCRPRMRRNSPTRWKRPAACGRNCRPGSRV